jgi:hypothetical protein
MDESFTFACVKILLTLFLSSRFVFNTCVFCICRDFLVDGLTIMKNRGYDSAGLATMAAGGGPMVRDFTTCCLIFVSVLYSTAL